MILSNKLDSIIDIEQNEKDFQEAFDNYWHTDTTKHDEKYYKQQIDKMWLCIYYACSNICKNIYRQRNIIIDDLEDVIMDAAEYCMTFILGKNRLHKLHRPEKLSSYCFLRCRYIIDSPKRQWEDKNVLRWALDEKGNYIDIIEGENNYAEGAEY